ncbi:MAG: DUF5685 family protein [Oscillospiraceae bacterium]|jgi:hypothetical protein|nr:DUF5685 family protein [Oscillospiraceae bacterium]
MFGYIKPCTPELKVRELERFKALYCGVCRALGKRYGLAARFVLSYDFVFLAALLWEPDGAVEVRKCRCPASLRRKRCVCADYADGNSVDKSAGLGIILAYHKLRDNARDEGFAKAAAAGLAMLALRSAYRKAAREFPAFDDSVRGRLDALDAAESDPDLPLDAAADKFALLLADVADTTAEPRVLHELLYHLGRWIYLIDARDDLTEDAQKGRANALTGRGIDDASLEMTLTHSNNLVISAFELLAETAWSDIIRNIICLGMPVAQIQVFAGTWKRNKGRKI